MESILTSIKKLLGIAEDYDHFDPDIMIHINSAFSVLTQLGVGPSEGFMITSKEQTWNDFMPTNPKMEMVKSYIHLKVRVLFDPPQSSAVAEAMNKSISEFEWRLNVEASNSPS